MLGRIGSAAVALGLIVARTGALAQHSIETPLKAQPIPETRQDADTGQRQNRAAQEEGETDRIISALNDMIQAAIHDLVSEEDAEYRQREENREKADLRAQQEMALWAKRMFWASVVSVGLTIMGLVFIYRTLVQTRRATDAAGIAADESRKSTVAAAQSAEAALEANTLHHNMFIAENRPWLCLESVSVVAPLIWEGRLARMKFRLCLQNFGRSVATDVHIRTIIDIDPESALWHTAQRLEREEQAAQYTALATGFNVIPERPYFTNLDIGIPEDEVAARLGSGVGHISPSLIGYVRYTYQAGQIRFGFPFNFCIFHVGADGDPVPIGPTTEM